MTKDKGKAKASKNQPKVMPLEHSLTPDPQADEAVTSMMAHALPADSFDEVTTGKAKPKKSKKSKEKKNTPMESADKIPKHRQIGSGLGDLIPQGKGASKSESEQGSDSGGEDSDGRDTDDYLRELQKLAAEFQEYKDRKKTGKRKFTVEEKPKCTSGDEDQSSLEFEEPDSSGPDHLPPSAKQSKTSTTMTTRKKARKDDGDDGDNQWLHGLKEMDTQFDEIFGE
ncbi:hypothetical protein SARC_02221 [Sphaeroforma arctica JP610]|uniref:Uncharacterized protein n=1 Tax=Sphaeroforma arctica JP610 TaxID=667725 RepID=A0A0L0G9D8_9EUKA|nr:hypothetical protein SARC_02221 [Sphaeroforma arctica JP610]KNC85600.1 hypothetical protein SARC_02221 [Sphaeroforma arctica JP610]|eukprot:XP_014159502.1 hypothetical protein SARC_02221 [Sphaeroforma arctica JP610]